MLVYPERMLRNLDSTGGLVFSGQLLLDLVEAGVLREDAYRIVQRNAMQAWREEKNFREMVSADPEITSRVKSKTLDRAFDLNRQLRNVDKIFKRVFPKVKSASKPTRSTSKAKKQS
jgi:adenylosuccinate lyase